MAEAGLRERQPLVDQGTYWCQDTTPEHEFESRLYYLDQLIRSLDRPQIRLLQAYLETTDISALTDEEIAYLREYQDLPDAQGRRVYTGSDVPCGPDPADIIQLARELGAYVVLDALKTFVEQHRHKRHRSRTPPLALPDNFPVLAEDSWVPFPRQNQPGETIPEDLPSFADIGRIERVVEPGLMDIEYLVVGGHPQTILTLEVHGDERFLRAAAEKLVKEKYRELGSFILVWGAHGEAIASSDVPRAKDDEPEDPTREKVKMPTAREFIDKNGQKYDLNRLAKYRHLPKGVSPEACIAHAKARQYFKIFQRYPTLKCYFALHADLTLPDGTYVYDVNGDYHDGEQEVPDPINDLVDTLIARMRKAYHQSGIHLRTGVADTEFDPTQNMMVEDGFIRISALLDNDGSFEDFVRILGMLGRNRIIKSFCCETSYKLQSRYNEGCDRVEEQLCILFDELIIPFVQELPAVP